MIVGPRGVGKSSLIRCCLRSLEDPAGIVWKNLRFCARTQACNVQTLLEAGLEKKRRTKLGPPVGSRVVVFVDDVNLPQPDAFGTKPPLELLRQLKDRKVIMIPLATQANVL